jgi:hypothetical protein
VPLAFPEKKAEILGLYKKRFDPITYEIILSFTSSPTESDSCSFYNVIYNYMKLQDGTECNVIENVRTIASDLGVAKEDVLE